MKAVTDASFKKDVVESPKMVLVDFWAEWCGPCRMIAPVLEELSAEMTDTVDFVKLNIDENPQIPSSLGIRSIPTLILFKGGKPVAIQVGGIPKGKLKTWIEENDAKF